jgi:hypothetical protein
VLERVAAKWLLATQTTRGGSHVAATPHRRVRVRGTSLPGCGPAADLVPQRPSSPAARAHLPGCPATIATPPPLPCRPQLRAAPLVGIRPRLTAASNLNDAASAAQPSSLSGLFGPERQCPRYPGRPYHNAPQEGGLGPATSTLPSGARAPSRPSPSVPGAHDCPVPQGPGSLHPRPARARLSALHRAAESAGSRSRPRPAPPPQGATAVTALATNIG